MRNLQNYFDGIVGSISSSFTHLTKESFNSSH